MKNMKKLPLLIAAAVACCLLSACGNKAEKPVDNPIIPDPNQPATVDSQPETVPDTDPEATSAPESEESQTLDTTDTEPISPEEETQEPEAAVSEDTSAAQTAAPEDTSAPETTEPATEPEVTTPAPETMPEIVISPASGKMYAKSDVNVRSGAGTDYERLGHLDAAEEVEITGLSENGWYRIVFKGGEGFVSSKYLQNEKPAPAQTAATTTTASPSEKTDNKPAADNKSSEDFMTDIKPVTLCPDKYLGKKSGTTYGKVERKTYQSKTTGNERPVNIVLPVNYSKDKKYPVMYVLHGIFCNENTMMDSWSTHYIIQNMVAAGEAEEMILVFPNMYAAKDKNMQPSFGDIDSVKPYDDFLKDLVNDLMPFIEKNYSVATGKDNTAIFGFSMGGRESLATGFTYPDKFGYVGAAAPAPGLTPGQDWAFKHPGQFKESELKFGDEKPYLLMVCAGDKDGTVGAFPKSYHNIMDKNKVTHIWWEIPGSDHGDPAIASGTYNFAKYAFKAK